MSGTVRPSLQSPLAACLRRPPLAVAPDASLLEAVRTMAAQRADAVVVVEPENRRPLGIFTLHDLLQRVAAEAWRGDCPLASVMTGADLIMLDWRSSLQQAVQLMARHGVGHVVVVDAAGRYVGLVSQDDVHELQSSGEGAIAAALRAANDRAGLVAVAADIRRLGRRLLEEGMAAEPLTQLISSLNDHLTVRVIEIVRTSFALPEVAWCWLAFGSEGRCEQTLTSDQDNGLIFRADTDEADRVRTGLLPFAQAVNEWLAACGFPLCKGGVMAGNSALCLSQEEWRGRFGGWIRANDAQAVLNAATYFDFRPLYGAAHLAAELRQWMLGRIGNAPLFLRFMVTDALAASPPLGLWQSFRLDRGGPHRHTLDLKNRGVRVFVDAARVLALAAGIEETGTVARLRALAERGLLGRDDVGALVDAFLFIQRLRLRQQQSTTTEGLANRLNPRQLNGLDRQILKEAFKQGRQLQRRLRLDYRL